MRASTTQTKENAITILKNDHKKVKELFEQFEQTDSLSKKKKIAEEAITELKIHAEIEEKIFYPVVRRELSEDDLMNEADEEHHVAKLLIAELEQMDGSEDHWEAKFTVLAENIRHHIKEEEGEMLPKARKENIDLDALGDEMLTAKETLKQHGVPPCDEEKLIAQNGEKNSPAKSATKKLQIEI
jgi:hemerythrin-like domain-containing protein